MNKLQCVVFYLLAFTLNNPVNVLAATFDGNVIEVKGQATVHPQQELQSITLDVVQTGRNVSKIRAFIESISEQIVNMAIALDIPKNDIQATEITLQTVDDSSSLYIQGVEVNQKLPQHNRGKVYIGGEFVDKSADRIQNFELSRTITVNFSNATSYDEFFSKVIKMGVERISPTTISESDSEKLYQQALTTATDNAKQKAMELANQLGVSLDKIIYLKELSHNTYKEVNETTTSAIGTSSLHNQRKNTDITATVLLKYSVKE